MIKYLIIILLCFYPIAYSQTIDVNIFGFDDGIITNRQKDYSEAVLSAKREAIERAGCRINALSKLKNSKLIREYIESAAQSRLLPGYNIIDIGYSSDGYYQIRLIAKIRIQDIHPKVDIPDNANSMNKDYGTLYVSTYPANAKIRVLNIKPVYKQGMKLKPGRYLLEISAKNYLTQKQSVDLKPNQELNLRVHLKYDSVSNINDMKQFDGFHSNYKKPIQNKNIKSESHVYVESLLGKRSFISSILIWTFNALFAFIIFCIYCFIKEKIDIENVDDVISLIPIFIIFLSIGFIFGIISRVACTFLTYML